MYRVYLLPSNHFTFPLFRFVGPPPHATLLIVLWIVQCLAAVSIGLGFKLRCSASLFLVLYTYFFLLEATYYNNHFYLIIVLASAFVVTSADSFARIDLVAFFKDISKPGPDLYNMLYKGEEYHESDGETSDVEDSVAHSAGNDHSQTVPRWQLLLFQFQILVVYFYAGVAKTSDDWLHGLPYFHIFGTCMTLIL